MFTDLPIEMRKKKRSSKDFLPLGKVVNDSLLQGLNYCIEHLTYTWDVKLTMALHMVLYFLILGILNGPPIRNFLFEELDPATIGGRLLGDGILGAGVYFVSKHIISKIDLKSSINAVIVLIVVILAQRPAWQEIKNRVK